MKFLSYAENWTVNVNEKLLMSTGVITPMDCLCSYRNAFWFSIQLRNQATAEACLSQWCSYCIFFFVSIVLWTWGSKTYVELIYIHVLFACHRLNWLLILCYNVIFHYIFSDKGRHVFSLPWKKLHRSTDECVTAFFHFSFSYVNIVVLEEYHFSLSTFFFHAKISWNS